MFEHRFLHSTIIRSLRGVALLVVLGMGLAGSIAGAADANATTDASEQQRIAKLLDPPQGLFSDEWLQIYIGDQKVGYAHSTRRREGDVIKSSMDVKMIVGRDNVQIEVLTKQTDEERVDGTPLAFSSKQKMSMLENTTVGEIKDGKVTVTMTQSGIPRTQTFDFPKGAVLANWGVYRESMLHGLEPGTKYTLRVYAPDMRIDDAVQATTEVVRKEQIILPRHGGERVDAYVVDTTLHAPAGDISMLAWEDDAGLPLRSKIPMPVLGDISMVTSTQAEALADFAPPEMFMNLTLKVDPLPVKKAKMIRYLIKTKDGAEGDLNIPATGMQTVKQRNGKQAIVTVRRQSHTGDPKAQSSGKNKLSADELRPFLSSNLMMNLEDPVLKKLAAKAMGPKTLVNPFQRADKLRRFVRAYIHDKSLDIGFATAGEVARNREGDCSEHGVLLAALGRLNGLPSRVVIGIAYAPVFGNAHDIFGYHMWTQFYIDGAWYDFDAALGDEEIPHPGRIAFAVSSLHNAGLADLSLPLMSKLGAIDLEVMKVEK